MQASEAGAPPQARHRAALLLVVLAPFLAKAPLLLGLLHADPMLLYGGMSSGLSGGWLGGVPPFPTIDPNIAFTSHALGHRAALELIQGRLPWWNHFEGVGAPLAGEMQSAALFPLTLLLLLLPGGQLAFHIALQLIAGLSTWALLRKLAASPLAACAGSLAYEFNGTFAWLANAVVNPVPFLPLLVLGVETVRARALRGERGGTLWVGLAVAGSIYAGFPEVAYLDGLLAGAWTLVRTAGLPAGQAWRYLLRTALAAVAGAAIAAPVLAAFLGYLPDADLAGHTGGAFAGAHISPGYLAATWAPYVFGAVFHYGWFAPFWGSVGGYAGLLLFALAVYGAAGPGHRPLRLMLALWIAAALALTFGAPGLPLLARLVPGLGDVALYRYAAPGWEFGLCVLAALGLTDLARHPARRRLGVILLATVAACGLAVLYARHRQIYLGGALGRIDLVLLALLAAAAGALLVALRRPQRLAAGLAALMVLEAAAYFVIPTLSWPAAGRVELGGVAFLQRRLGYQRFATFGPVQPNYGSWFGLASVNHNDLPIPAAWTAYVRAHLDADAPAVLFTGGSAIDDLAASLDAYRKVGVRYVLLPPDVLQTPAYAALRAALAAAPPGAGLTPVYADRGMRIFELPGAQPYLSAPGCRLAPRSRDELRADCAAPAPLTRLELMMRGWRATIDGHPVPIRLTGEIFQQVDLPAGASVVRFAYRPPWLGWATAAFVAGWLLLAATLRMGAPRPRPAPGD